MQVTPVRSKALSSDGHRPWYFKLPLTIELNMRTYFVQALNNPDFMSKRKDR